MMFPCKQNRLRFATLVLAFTAYFFFWAHINQQAQMQVNWPMWRGALIVGSIFLARVFFVARDKYFNVNTILAAFIIPLLIGLLWLLGFVLIYWRLPELGAGDVAALFMIEGYAVIFGGIVESL